MFYKLNFHLNKAKVLELLVVRYRHHLNYKKKSRIIIAKRVRRSYINYTKFDKLGSNNKYSKYNDIKQQCCVSMFHFKTQVLELPVELYGHSSTS